jgi:hypothetical protein
MVNIASGTEVATQDAIKATLERGVAKTAVAKIRTTARSELKILIKIAEFKVLSPIKKLRVQ